MYYVSICFSILSWSNNDRICSDLTHKNALVSICNKTEIFLCSGNVVLVLKRMNVFNISPWLSSRLGGAVSYSFVYFAGIIFI